MPVDVEALYRIVDEIAEAVDAERMANNDEARETAQQRAIDLHRQFLQASGVRSIKRRRILTHMQGRLSGAEVNEELFPQGHLDLHTVGGRRQVRRIAAMLVYDSDVLDQHQAAGVMSGLYAAEKGTAPLVGNEDGPHGGILWEPEAISGRPALSELELHLQNKVVGALGYEAGVRKLPASKRLIPELLDAASRYLRNASTDHRSKGKVQDRSAATIQRWCNAQDSQHREHFESCYRQGLKDVEEGRVDASRRLTSLRLPSRK